MTAQFGKNLAAVGLLGLAGWTAPAWSQAVETHPAPILQGQGAARLDAGKLINGSTDATPFGVNLSGLMLVDAHAGGQARPKTGPGIDAAAAGPIAQSPALTAKLRPFLGQPLSYKVISEIEAAITAHYREKGRSLVLVTVPPQEITSGVLQVNINTFRLEGTPALAGDAANGPHVKSQIRAREGQEVDTGQLLEDVAWLNQNPFRQVAVQFEPGQTADGTRLTLQVQSKRPWSAYVGAANSGSEDTGIARLFAGFNISALPWQDQQLSFQTNAAPDSIGAGLWDTDGTKGYVSHALGYFIPVTLNNGFRFKVTAGLSHVSSFAVPDPLLPTATTTDGATLELAFPLARRTGTWSLMPEVYLGVEADRYARTDYFGNLVIDREKTRLTHVALGLRSSLNGRIFGRPSHGDFDLSFVSVSQDTDGSSLKQSYLTYSLGQTIGLEGGRQLALRLAGQSSGDDLHPLEQMGLGGETTVRGYGSNAVSGSTAFAFSMEYGMAPFDVPLGDRVGRLAPHLFADWGYGSGAAGAAGDHLASVGLGARFDVGEQWQANFDLSRALTAAGKTEAGDFALALRLMTRF